MGEQWEYTSFSYQASGVPKKFFLEKANELGKNGWELVMELNLLPEMGSGCPHFIFRRRLP